MITNNSENSFPKAARDDMKALKSYKYMLCRAAESIAMLGSPGLMKSINETNLERYRLTARSILKASLDINANQVARYAKYLEDAAKAGDTSYIASFTPAFIACLHKAVADIDKAVSDYFDSYPKPKQDRPDGHILAKLREACRFYRIDEINELVEELSLYRYENGGELVAWLEASVGAEAYGAVAEVLSKR